MKRLILDTLNGNRLYLMHGSRIKATGRGLLDKDKPGGVDLLEADGIGDFNMIARFIKSKNFNLVIQ